LRTIARQRNVIRNIFNVAEERWGFKLPDGNPFTIDLSSYGKVKHRRRRRLKDGELERLIEACKECRDLNPLYLPLGIYLAIETGMRTDEIFNLTWQDVNMKTRRIEIQGSKIDRYTEYEGREIVLPFHAQLYLETVYRIVSCETTFKQSDPIFPMTKGAYGQSFRDAKKRAKITGLTFHDLRHEASSRFDEAELSKPQRDLMTGHNPKDVSDGYPVVDLKRIQDKLDIFTLGQPLAEIEAASRMAAVDVPVRVHMESRGFKEMELFLDYLTDAGFPETVTGKKGTQILENVIPMVRNIAR
jgi:integrase